MVVSRGASQEVLLTGHTEKSADGRRLDCWSQLREPITGGGEDCDMLHVLQIKERGRRRSGR